MSQAKFDRPLSEYARTYETTDRSRTITTARFYVTLTVQQSKKNDADVALNHQHRKKNDAPAAQGWRPLWPLDCCPAGLPLFGSLRLRQRSHRQANGSRKGPIAIVWMFRP